VVFVPTWSSSNVRRMPLRRLTLDEVTIDDEASFRSVALYGRLKDELRRAQLGAQEVVNSAFAAAKVPPPHQTPRGERGPMRSITPTRTWDQTRADAEAKERRPRETPEQKPESETA